MKYDVPFRQVSSLVWASGESKSVGWIRLPPDIVSGRTGIQFAAGIDDLDPFLEAGLQLGSGRVVFLLHRSVPDYGIDVYADMSDDGHHAMRELIAALGLADEETIVFERSSHAR